MAKETEIAENVWTKKIDKIQIQCENFDLQDEEFDLLPDQNYFKYPGSVFSALKMQNGFYFVVQNHNNFWKFRLRIEPDLAKITLVGRKEIHQSTIHNSRNYYDQLSRLLFDQPQPKFSQNFLCFSTLPKDLEYMRRPNHDIDTRKFYKDYTRTNNSYDFHHKYGSYQSNSMEVYADLNVSRVIKAPKYVEIPLTISQKNEIQQSNVPLNKIKYESNGYLTESAIKIKTTVNIIQKTMEIGYLLKKNYSNGRRLYHTGNHYLRRNNHIEYFVSKENII